MLTEEAREGLRASAPLLAEVQARAPRPRTCRIAALATANLEAPAVAGKKGLRLPGLLLRTFARWGRWHEKKYPAITSTQSHFAFHESRASN